MYREPYVLAYKYTTLFHFSPDSSDAAQNEWRELPLQIKPKPPAGRQVRFK
jgi:hypothetical protein